MAADDRAGESVAEKTATKKKKVRQWENGEWVLENSFVTAAHGQTLRKPCGVGFTRCGPEIRSESRKAHDSEHRLGPSSCLEMRFGNGPLPMHARPRQTFARSTPHGRYTLMNNSTHPWSSHPRFQKSLLLCPPPGKCA